MALERLAWVEIDLSVIKENIKNKKITKLCNGQLK